MSHMTALGFPVTTEQDFRRYVYQASEFGQKLETVHGSYTLWEPGNGIELWVRTNLHGRIIGMKPHFTGSAGMQVGLARRIIGRESSILDGAFYGWADPRTDDPEIGKYPFVFDTPDYDRYNDLYLPCLRTIQLAAFADELQAFESEEAYEVGQKWKRKFASECFIPGGFFASDRMAKEESGSARAFLSGHVLETERKVNLVTGQKFYWARVRTFGGEVDVVADSQVVQGRVVTGGVIQGNFWLSGRCVQE